MEASANKNGKMTTDRVDALKAFVRQSEGMATKQIAKMRSNPIRPIISEKEAKALGDEILKETHEDKPDLDKVRALVDRGADLDIKEYADTTALMWVTVSGLKDFAEILIRGGADVDVKDRDGETALLHAARHNQEEIAKMLLDYGANVNSTAKNGKTALGIAAHVGHPKIAEMLLESGANPDTMANNKWTPLLSAATNRHAEIVRMLLEHGADPAQEWEYGMTAEKLTDDLGIQKLLRNAIEGRPYDY